MVKVAKEVQEMQKTAAAPAQTSQSLNFSKSKPLAMDAKKFVWFDMRNWVDGEKAAPLFQAISQLKFDGVMVNDELIKQVPPGVKKIKEVTGLSPTVEEVEKYCETHDVVILNHEVIRSSWYKENKNRFKKMIATSVNVIDPASLQLAVEMTHYVKLLIVEFKDETKIPLEIVLADAQNHQTQVVMKVKDDVEAKVVFGVLECGADGVIVQNPDIAQIYALNDTVNESTQALHQQLQHLTVLKTKHIGMGDRACVDLTSYMGLDEGILLGSFSCGGILATSETHPLPYMPTRPFRVNAGSLQTYVLAPDNQTWYLSDLRSGMEVLAVSTSGKARRVSVGRVKIERRPLLYIEVQAPDNTVFNVIMQEDWHVRVFGIDGKPINITTLKPGDKVLGYTMEPGRHVGVKVDELIIEQ